MKNDGAAVPLRNGAKSCWFVLLDNRYSPLGRQLIQDLGKRAPKYRCECWMAPRPISKSKKGCNWHRRVATL